MLRRSEDFYQQTADTKLENDSKQTHMGFEFLFLPETYSNRGVFFLGGGCAWAPPHFQPTLIFDDGIFCHFTHFFRPE